MLQYFRTNGVSLWKVQSLNGAIKLRLETIAYTFFLSNYYIFSRRRTLLSKLPSFTIFVIIVLLCEIAYMTIYCG